VSTAGTSALVAPFLTVTDSNATFEAVNGFQTSSAGSEPLVITVDGAYTFSNNVAIRNGRFFPPSSNQAFTFYTNEPISTTYGSNILFTTAAVMSNVYSSPSLPAGLSIVNSGDSNNFFLQGAPLTTYSPSNYIVIGQNAATGKVVTTTVNLQVKGERITMDVSSYSAALTVGSTITPQVFNATFPTYGFFGFSFSWASTLPDGLYFTDNTGAPISSNVFTYVPVSSPYRIGVAGTPTLTAANKYADNGISSITIPVTARQSRGTTSLSTTFSLSFPFNETVLFRNIVVPTLYKDKIVLPNLSSKMFDVGTYFSNVGTAITSFTPTTLEAGTLTVVSNASNYSWNGVPSPFTILNYELGGTPITVGSNTYTFSASNAHGVSRTLTLTIPVRQDIVTFDYGVTPSNGTAYNFILSRPLNTPLAGYYPYPIKFKASANSGNAITYTIDNVTSYGLLLDSGNGDILSGTPTKTQSPQVITVTATASGTNASNITEFVLTVLDDVLLTNNIVPLSFFQNIAATPFQLSLTTLSQRPVVNYFATTAFPAGLSVSINGLISGRPTVSGSGMLAVSASTGYKVFQLSIPYTITSESILFITGATAYSLTPGANIPPIDVRAVSYSGTHVSNISFYNSVLGDPMYGFTFTPFSSGNEGIIGGTLYNGLPPSQLLPNQAFFNISASVGNTTDSAVATLYVVNPIVARSYVFENVRPGSSPVFNTSQIGFSENASNVWKVPKGSIFTNDLYSTVYQYTDFQIDNQGTVELSRYVAILSTSFNGYIYTYAVLLSYGNQFITAAYIPIYNTVILQPSRTWYSAGTEYDIDTDTYQVVFYTSPDGESWYPTGTPFLFVPRTDPTLTESYFLKDGLSFRTGKDDSGNDIFMLGGDYDTFAHSMYRSSDLANSWIPVSGGFTAEVANFNLNGPTWVVTGSDGHHTGELSNFAPTTTIRYSTDYGMTWLPSPTTGSFNLNAYDVVYGNGTWMATGINYDASIFSIGLAYSADGGNWTNVPQFDIPIGTTPPSPNIGIGPIQYDSNTDRWNVFVKMAYPDGINSNTTISLYTHDNLLTYNIGWTNKLIWSSISTYFLGSVVVYNNVFYYSLQNNNFNKVPSITSSAWNVVPDYVSGNTYNQNQAVKITDGINTGVYVAGGTTSTNPLYPDSSPGLIAIWMTAVYPGNSELGGFTPPIYIASGTTEASLSITSSVFAGGPVFTSPVVTSYNFYQYIKISPITCAATGTGTIYLFAINLPQGLVFDPITGIISGIPSKAAQNQTATLYAKDNNGISVFTLSINVIVPFILNPQFGAGAYTSLLRQSVLVNAAHNAVNNEVLPSEKTTLGSFMSPDVADTIKHELCPCTLVKIKEPPFINIPGCVLWLDGTDPTGTGIPPTDGINITTWADKSGAGNDANSWVGNVTYTSASRSLYFDGSSGFQITSLSASINVESAFIVFNAVHIGGDGGINTLLGCKNSEGGRQFRVGGTPTTEICLQTIKQGVIGVVYLGADMMDNKRYLGEYVNDGTTLTHYLNGKYYASGNALTYNPGITTSIGIRYGPIEGITGTISEILVFNTPLSTGQRQQIENYLLAKWF
jgi:hypothetical protein